MPRQPYLRIVPNPRGARLDVGIQSIGQRPKLESIISNCLLSWPFVEAQMALVLGQLLGAENAAALAVFNALRRSSSQREAISEAAKASLSEIDQELLGALLNVHKATEIERNALAHGHFGISTKLPDDILWMTTNDYVAFKADQELTQRPSWDDDKHAKLLATFWVYRLTDVSKILLEIGELAQTWYDFLKLLQTRQGSDKRAESHRQLCDQPRIVQELVKLRREKTPPARHA